MGGTESAQQLLRFWRAIEMVDHPLWREHPLPPGKIWRFTVYEGL